MIRNPKKVDHLSDALAVNGGNSRGSISLVPQRIIKMGVPKPSERKEYDAHSRPARALKN